MARSLVQVDEERFLGFGCSNCNWRFSAKRVPTGKSFSEFVRNFEKQRDDEFREHICKKEDK